MGWGDGARKSPRMGVGMAPEHQATEGAPTVCWPWGSTRTRDGVFTDRPHTSPRRATAPNL